MPLVGGIPCSLTFLLGLRQGPVDAVQEEGVLLDALLLQVVLKSLEQLAGLKTPFRKNGVVTAGNASGVNDGAAALIVAMQLLWS